VDTATLKGTCDLAILDLMLYLGLRREEVVQLTLADLRQDGGRWWLFVAGKGQKTRTPGSAASLTPHDLRRTAARTAYDNRATLIQVQEMLGHADPKTTALYIGADANDADTAVDHVCY
jgi:integrase